MNNTTDRGVSPELEKAAKAIEQMENPLSDGSDWGSYVEHARAALLALREPTEGMCEAGNQKSHDDGLIEGGAVRITEEIGPIFTAMIDAVLGEPK